MKEVLDLADRLGKAISSTQRYTALREAEKAVEEDAEASALQKEYTDLAGRIHGFEEAGKPIEPQDKRLLQSKKEQMIKNRRIQDVTRAWADYNEMILKVNRLVFQHLGRE